MKSLLSARLYVKFEGSPASQKSRATECQAEKKKKKHVEGRSEFPLCLQMPVQDGAEWMQEQSLPNAAITLPSTSAPQQSCIKFSLHLFPESIISFSLFIFHMPGLQYDAVPDSNSSGCSETFRSLSLKVRPRLPVPTPKVRNHFRHVM